MQDAGHLANQIFNPISAGCEFRHVATGTKSPLARSREHNGSYRLIAADAIHDIAKLLGRLQIDRIERVRTVNRIPLVQERVPPSTRR